MSDSRLGTPLVEAVDDNQLTIRIPNPKVFMARQSQWKGRRGKPRCDHCRLNNLKCDRVLPTCNHCSWATRECKYTPLPTPAHRGIPRCDRCRFHNLKCDRNLPVCNHCTEDEGAECNYTPKKRHKVPSDHAAAAKERQPTQPYTAKTASFLISDMPNEENYTTGNWIAEHPEALRGRLPPGMYEIYSSGSQGSDDESMDGSNSPRHRPSHDRSWEARMLSAGPSGSRPCAFEGTLLPSRYLDPWYHSAFAPLPRSILQGIRTVNPVEMPSRQNYDEALFKFLHDLPPELGEISAFSPEEYSDLARAVAEGDTARLSSRLKSWTQFHHVRSGSRKYHLLLLPREAYFSIRPEKEDRLRNEFIAEVDGETPTNKSSVTSTGHGPGQHVINSHEGVSAFLRIPVLPQIYDVLVYAHKNHASSAQTLAQVRQAGVACVTWPMVETFVRLCPLCNLRAKSTPQQ